MRYPPTNFVDGVGASRGIYGENLPTDSDLSRTVFAVEILQETPNGALQNNIINVDFANYAISARNSRINNLGFFMYSYKGDEANILRPSSAPINIPNNRQQQLSMASEHFPFRFNFK